MSTACECGSVVESPPGKKLKVENDSDGDRTGKVEAGGSDLQTVNDESGYDSDDWRTMPNKDESEKYFQQINESDGFEFDKYPGSSLYAPICRIYPGIRLEDFPEFDAEIRSFASMAIKQYFGNDGKERPITEIVRINGEGRSDYYYYITFKINNGGAEETFQAQVIDTLANTIEIAVIRRKPN